jgi:hypothetical protein
MRTPLAAALASLALAAPAAAHHLTWVESLVTGAAGDQFDAHLGTGGVVYTNTASGTADVAAFSRFGTVVVASGLGNQDEADISGDVVVYLDDSAGNDNVAEYDLALGVTRVLTFTADDESSPAISGNHVVFARRGNIIVLDRTTGAADPLSLPGVNASAPDIDGDLVVWQQVDAVRVRARINAQF